MGEVSQICDSQILVSSAPPRFVWLRPGLVVRVDAIQTIRDRTTRRIPPPGPFPTPSDGAPRLEAKEQVVVRLNCGMEYMLTPEQGETLFRALGDCLGQSEVSDQ